MTRTSLILLGAAAITAMFGCNGPNAAPTPPESRTGPPACDAAAARSVAVQFGQRLKNVPLLAADDRLVPVLQKEYGPYITRPLLEAWTRDPHTAPGREVSSPWPDRIEVAGVTPAANGACAVEGAVVYQTSVEATAISSASVAPLLDVA